MTHLLERNSGVACTVRKVPFIVCAFAPWLMAIAATPDAAKYPPVFKAKIVDRANREKLLYNYSHETKVEGEKRIVKNIFTSPEGAEVVVEDVEFDGARLKSYRQQQKQVGADGKVEVQGDRLVFTLAKGGSSSTASEARKDNFVVGPSLIPFLLERWEAVAAGKPIDVRFAVVDRKETLGFTLKKQKEIDRGGRRAFVVRMKPTSFVIAALVDPLYFTLDAETGRLLELEGRVLPKKKVGEKWADLDAVTLYEYPN